MNENILQSVKRINNVAKDDKSFDQELIMYINSALMTIMQEWHGMDHSFVVEDGTEEWSDLLGDNTDFEGVKQLVGLKVKLMFDPPTNSSVMQAINDQIKEQTRRLTICGFFYLKFHPIYKR